MLRKEILMQKGIMCQNLSGTAVVIQTFMIMVIKCTEQTNNLEAART
jgi:hypothetical protein